MKIKCNCCKESPVFELGEPRNHQQVLCDCGKLLAVGRVKKNGEKDWFVYDIFYDSDHDFSPVSVIEQ